MTDVPSDIVQRWQLNAVEPVADTGHARVFMASAADGSTYALKLYRRTDRGNETPGTQLMRLWHARGAVQIVDESENAVLMEWLEGPSLGDQARSGHVDWALATLAETARSLHADPVSASADLNLLSDVFAPLKNCRFSSDASAPFVRDMSRAIQLGQMLIESQNTMVPLHGDLHPDNVILTKNGPRIIDAKGYVGDPAFELANAIRHPKGMKALVRQPDQVDRCLTLYSDALDVPRQRLAQWAAAKCALSIFWRANGPVTQDDEADLLSLLLDAAGQ